MAKYTEYVEAERSAGREPLPMNQWRAQRMHESQKQRTAEAERGFSTSPEPIAESDPDAGALPLEDEADEPSIAALEDYNKRVSTINAPPPPSSITSSMQPPISLEGRTGALVFQCKSNRWRVEIMQAGDRVVGLGGQVARVPHRVIEFNDWHWTADLDNPDHREKAEWLVHSEAWRKGEIRLVNRAQHQERVVVQTGPRTSSTSRIQKIDRPAGQLSARLE